MEAAASGSSSNSATRERQSGPSSLLIAFSSWRCGIVSAPAQAASRLDMQWEMTARHTEVSHTVGMAQQVCFTLCTCPHTVEGGLEGWRQHIVVLDGLQSGGQPIVTSTMTLFSTTAA